MQSINIKTYSDNQYQPADNHRLTNILFFSPNHISSVVADTGAKQILELKVISGFSQNVLHLSYDELKSITPLMDGLKDKYKERRVVIVDKHSTLVPDALLNIIEPEAYHQLNHLIIPNSQVLYCKMHVQQTAVLFNVRNELVKLIRFNMPMVDVFHSSLLFIKAIEHQQFSDPSNKLHLQIHPGYFELLNLDKQIKFYNTFAFENETEIVYFLLAVAEQLQITEACEVIIYGNSPMIPALQLLLSKYVKNVQFGIKPKNFIYPGSFKEFAEYHFFTESSAILCE